MWFSLGIGPARFGISSKGRVSGSVGAGPFRVGGSAGGSVEVRNEDLEGLALLMGRWVDAVVQGWRRPLWGHRWSGSAGMIIFRALSGISCICWRIINTALYTVSALSLMFLMLLPSLIMLAIGLALLYIFGSALIHTIFG
ncbi:hypothetical protein ABZW49_16070 [Nonomuraea wenchangensis]